MSAPKTIIAIVSLTFLVACAEKKVETPEELQEAFASKTAEAPQGQPPEIQAMVSQAVQSLQKKDDVAAVATLQTLRAVPDLSVDQALAIQDMMVEAQKRLVNRAAQGDPQAQAALEMMKYKHR